MIVVLPYVWVYAVVLVTYDVVVTVAVASVELLTVL